MEPTSKKWFNSPTKKYLRTRDGRLHTFEDAQGYFWRAQSGEATASDFANLYNILKLVYGEPDSVPPTVFEEPIKVEIDSD